MCRGADLGLCVAEGCDQATMPEPTPASVSLREAALRVCPCWLWPPGACWHLWLEASAKAEVEPGEWGFDNTPESDRRHR